uniref:V-type proton ATPase subunit E n=1 Tax=Paramoeba aestuarina TaxID=180227 RepID=A0A7S4P7A3_9EUKA|mmetsp:Transcript_37453/g.59039  ORF Transcript_37453/g.59039 Transcript_37453/m.59039 type:complete len:216 (+) Transcript_37453:93-740(+)
MDDNTVKAQLRRMRDFILDEAQNKKTEIQQSAEEEANRERDRLIRQGEIAITKELDKKRKQVETAKKIRASNELNQSRLQILRAREEAVNSVCGQAHAEVMKLSDDHPIKYKKLLHDLALQSLEVMEEDKVEFVVREKDTKILGGMLGDVAKKYQEKTGQKCEVSLSDKHLDASSAGGVVAVAGNGAVIISNTLEQRLQLAVEALLPNIRQDLFA